MAQYWWSCASGTGSLWGNGPNCTKGGPRERYLTDQSDEVIAAAEKAVQRSRELGDKPREGGSLRWLSEALWCPGRAVESDHVARQAVALLELLPPGRELAMAYGRLAWACTCAEAIKKRRRGLRQLELAQRLGDTEVTLNALGTLGKCQFDEGGLEKLEESLESAVRLARLAELAGHLFIWLAGTAVDHHRYDVAARYLEAGSAVSKRAGPGAVPVLPARLSAPPARPGALVGGCRPGRVRLGHPVHQRHRGGSSPWWCWACRARRGDPGAWPLVHRGVGPGRRRRGSCPGWRSRRPGLKPPGSKATATRWQWPPRWPSHLRSIGSRGDQLANWRRGVGAPALAQLSVRALQDRTHCN